MGPGYVARRFVRARRNSYAGIAILLGLTAGLALFSVAAARRTQSSYPRFLRSVNPSTVAITTNGNYDDAINARIAAFPEVVSSRTYVGFQVYVLRHGRPDFSSNYEASGTFDGRYVDQDRFTATDGRRFDPARVDEVVVNEFAADRLGLHVGDRLDLGTYSLEQISDPSFFSHPPAPVLRMRARLVGIGVLPEEVLQDDGDRSARLLLTPAYSRRAKQCVTYGLQGLVLEHGDDDITRVNGRLRHFSPAGTTDLRVTSVDTFHAQQAVRPLSIALALFGAITGVASIALVAQACNRVVRVGRTDRATLRALGLTRAALVRVMVIGPALAVVTGAMLAVALAIAMSPLAPVGPVRRVEVASGIDADMTVLLVGAAIAVVVPLAIVALFAWREAARTGTSPRITTARATRVVTAASYAGASPPAVAGLRFAVEPPDVASGTASRSVILGAAIAIAALVGAITFGTSLDHLVRRPALFGWNWDATILGGNGYDNLPLARAESILAADEHVAAWAGASFGAAAVDGRDVPLLGMSPGGDVGPSIVHGRSIRDDDEIVLGATTAQRLHEKIGSTVSLAGENGATTLTVVGVATFPTIGPAHVGRTSLGVGALVDPAVIPGIHRNILGQRERDLGPNAIFVRFRPGTPHLAELARLRAATLPLAGFAGIDVLPAQRPAEIVNSSSIGGAPVLLAVALVLAATVSLGLALTASVRRRRDDLRVLSALGFTPRQLSATVSWHATTTVVLGLIVGVPAGVVIGRTLWNAFARRLDVVAEPHLPAVATIAIVAGAIVVGNVVAAIPARAARRVRAAHAVPNE